MIDVNTGQTVYEIIQSFDTNNNPITGVTFDLNFYVNGQLSNTITPNINLINSSKYGKINLQLTQNTEHPICHLLLFIK